jgi:hypothetical protein
MYRKEKGISTATLSSSIVVSKQITILLVDLKLDVKP